MQQTVNKHIAFCDPCFNDYVALAGPERVSDAFKEMAATRALSLEESRKLHEARRRQEKMEAFWGELVDKTKDFILDLEESHPPGTSLSRGRTLAKEPNRAQKISGKVVSEHGSRSTVFRIWMADKSRFAESLEANLTPKGAVFCNIKRSSRDLDFPMIISVWWAKGEGNMCTIKADDRGDAQFFIPSTLEDVLIVFNLRVNDNQEWFALRPPKENPLLYAGGPSKHSDIRHQPSALSRKDRERK